MIYVVFILLPGNIWMDSASCMTLTRPTTVTLQQVEHLLELFFRAHRENQVHRVSRASLEHRYLMTPRMRTNILDVV